MGDWTTAENTLADMLTNYQQAANFRWTAKSEATYAKWDFDDGFYNLALEHIIDSGIALSDAVWYLLGYNSDYDPPYIFPYFNTNYGSVTWKSIIEAWGTNDFEGRAWTIAFIDRMRQLLWNEPFDITFAARPEQKEIPE